MKYAIAFLFLCAAGYTPKKIDVKLVHFGNPYSTVSENIFIFNTGKEWIESRLPIRLSGSNVIVKRDPCRRYEDARDIHWCLKNWVGKTYGKWKGVTHVFVAPVYMGGKRFILGAANFGKIAGGVSFSVSERDNSDGVNRVPHSILAFIHEFLHLLGAKHRGAEGTSIMALGGSLGYQPTTLPLIIPMLPETTQDVLNFLF